MTAGTATRSVVPAPAPPALREARFDDYGDIVRLLSAFSLDIRPLDDWHELRRTNPLSSRMGSDSPIGWVLANEAGRIVGFLETIPSRYWFRGDELISAVACAWVVDAAYRGFALHLIDEYFNQPHVDLFINTTVGAMALDTFSQLSTRIPLGEWESTSFWVTGYRGFAKKTLQKRRVPFAELLALPAGAALQLKDAVRSTPLPRTPGSFLIEAVDRFDSRFDVFWDELLRHNPEKLLAERTSRALSWHFAAAMRRRRLWIFTASRHGRLRAYCTLTQQDHVFGPAVPGRDDMSYLRGMRLVDYQSIEPEADLLPGLLEAALRRCSAENVHLLEHEGRGLPKMRALDACVPYRRKLPNWNFFYRAADPELHATLEDPRCWDPSAFDGDMSL